MSKRAEELATRFEKAFAELKETIAGLSDEQWKAICGDEKWTVAATAHHVVTQFPLEMEYLTASSIGMPLPEYNWDYVNGKNEARARANSAASKDEVLTLFKQAGPPQAAWVRALSDEQLDRSAPLALANGANVTTQQLIEGGVLISHVTDHLASIKAAIG